MLSTGNLGEDEDSVSIGAWITLTDPLVAFSLAAADYDWLCVDEQHGSALPADTLGLIGAARAAGGRVLVRTAWNRPELIGRALDSGATGVIVPMVQTATEAEAAAAACRYPPRGGRSWGPARVSYDSPGDGITAANESVRCFVMIETPDAVERVEQIAAVPGVDGVFVGPFDLSIALGLPVDELLADDSDASALSRVVRACRARAIVAGAYAGTVDRASALRSRGFSLLAVTSDSDLLATGARSVAADARRSLA